MPSLFASPRLARGSWSELFSDWSVAAMGVNLLAPRPERRAANGFVCVCVVELSFARLDQVAVSPSELSLICVQMCSAMSHDCRSLTVRKWSSAALWFALIWQRISIDLSPYFGKELFSFLCLCFEFNKRNQVSVALVFYCLLCVQSVKVILR